MTFCQSCGMPLNADVMGKNADGSINEDYCLHCYQNGEFTSDLTMEEMIDICVPFMAQANPELNEETCRVQLEGFLPSLKRWRE